MIDLQKLLEVLIVPVLLALIGASGLLWKTRNDYVTKLRELQLAEDKQHTEAERLEVEEQTAAVSAANVITSAAANMVKLRDADVAEMRAEIRALQSEVVALGTSLTLEKEARLRASMEVSILSQQLSETRDALAVVKATLTSAQDERARLMRENNNMRDGLYNMALGVNALVAQVKLIGKGEVEPAYILGVPFDSDKPASV